MCWLYVLYVTSYTCNNYCVSEVKRTEVYYAVSPQTLSDEKKHGNEGKCSDEGKRSGEGKQTRVGHDYDYASTGPISVRKFLTNHCQLYIPT